MSDHIVVDPYNVNELVELEMWLQENRSNNSNINNRNNRNEKYILPRTARKVDYYNYYYDDYESEEEKKERMEYLTTGELPRRGDGVFTVYSGLRTQR